MTHEGMRMATKKAVALAKKNAAASIITTRKGALRVMPSMKEVENLIESMRN